MSSARLRGRAGAAPGPIGGMLEAGMARLAGRRPPTLLPIGVTITAAPRPTARRTR
ncbi:MAG TPA: hypothetical protein VGL20_19535 [Candidatus Dormibacteraeota bacterium]